MFKTFWLKDPLYHTFNIQIACICIGINDMILGISHVMLVEAPKFDGLIVLSSRLPSCH